MTLDELPASPTKASTSRTRKIEAKDRACRRRSLVLGFVPSLFGRRHHVNGSDRFLARLQGWLQHGCGGIAMPSPDPVANGRCPSMAETVTRKRQAGPHRAGRKKGRNPVMTALTALPAGRRPRRARTLAAALLTVGLALGGGIASAGTAHAASGATCHDALLGGTFFCTSSGDYTSGEAWWTFPNGTKQLFVIGTDNAVWTRWNNTSGNWSAWTSMGGIAIRFPPQFYSQGIFLVTGSGTYTPDLTVVGTDGGVWHRERGGDGVWGAWTAGY
jgi:hypothetical protein